MAQPKQPQSSKQEVTHVEAGYDANVFALKRMAKAVRDSRTSPRIRNRVRTLFADLPSMNVDAEIARVWEFINQSIRYMPDPLGTEFITDPSKLDEQIDEGTAAEDCEGIALYAATLFAIAGIPSYFEIQGRNALYPKRFRHCSLVVQNRRSGTLTSFDPVGYHEGNARGASFDLGDSLARQGDPIEFWSIDGEKVKMSYEPKRRIRYRSQATGQEGMGDVADDILNVVNRVGQAGADVYRAATGKPASGLSPQEQQALALRLQQQQQGFDWQKYLPWAIGGIALYFVLKKTKVI